MAQEISDLHPSLAELNKITNGTFTSISGVTYSKSFKYCTYLLIILFILLVCALIFLPWQQTSYATGSVVPYHPNDRLQEITSPIKGMIFKWYVVEGGQVKEGDTLAEVRDIDPQYTERLDSQKTATLAALKASEIALETSAKNLERQRSLSIQGIKSERDYELARLEYNKFVAEVSQKQKELADIETKISRQASQLVKASRDGTIMRIFYPQGGVFVKSGDAIASLMPESSQNVVELYVDGNDLPFVSAGSTTRLQFEGWPAIQISGWPSVAIGFFKGEVKVIDRSESKRKLFRILVFPAAEGSEKWPADHYLRQGVRVKGWIQLGAVPLWYELWRKFNDFPPEFPIKKKKTEKTLGFQLGKSVGKISK